MNYDRRRVGLEAKIQLLSEALEKQKKTRDGKSGATVICCLLIYKNTGF